MDRRLLADTRPLANPHFKRLWRANIVTVVGAQLTVVAVPAQIYAMTGSSAYVGLTGIFGLVPLVVFGLWGGALADAFDRRTLLLITTCGLIATSAGFWLQAALGAEDVWLLLSLFAVQQAFFAVNQPTRSALLPRLLDEELLPAANSLNMTVMQAGGIAGPLVGGALIPLMGFSWLYLLDTITLFATLGAVVRLPPLPILGVTVTPGIGAVIDGFRYLRTQPVLMMSFVVDIIAMVFGMPRALFPELADVAFSGPNEGGVAFALLFAAIPVGAVVGGVLSGWVSRVERQGLAVIVSILVWGVAMVGFGVAAMLAPVAPALFLGDRGADARDRRRRRHGVRRLPYVDAAGRGRRLRARAAAGHLHRRGRRRPARRRRPPRRDRCSDRRRRRGRRRRGARDHRHGPRRARRARLRPLPGDPGRGLSPRLGHVFASRSSTVAP